MPDVILSSRPPRSDITAKMIASSVCLESATRIDTLQLRYPRIIHAEVMTHRVFSRNASSSRAIPVQSMTARDEIFIPEFAKNKPGMQAGALVTPEVQDKAVAIWRTMADACLAGAAELAALGIHKQWANRPLEWFGYIDVVMTSTTWSNWDALRDHSDAQPEIEDLARVMKIARDGATSEFLSMGEWHLPYIDDAVVDDIMWLVDSGGAGELLDKVRFAFTHPGLLDVDDYTKLMLVVSAARCCRVSYAKHDGTPSSLEDDIKRFCGLALSTPKHASPMEHQARAAYVYDDPYLYGNFDQFSQFRKFIPNENL